MIDYSQWPERSRKTLRLKLDPNNVRLNKLQIKSEVSIIKYMIENEKIMLLARSIAKKGYLPNEAPIVVLEDNNYVVIEGNRRVTACKILLKPELAPKSFQSRIKKLRLLIEPSLIEKLTVLIAPDRPSTKVVVHNRHTGTELRERWDSGKQDVFFQRDIQEGFSIEDIAEQYDAVPSEIKESIIRFNMYEEAKKLDLPQAVKISLMDEENFPITTFARIWSFNELREFLGIAFSADGAVIKLLPDNEFEKRFGFLVSEIVAAKLNSRTINSEEEVLKYVALLKRNKIFNLELVPRVPIIEELKPKENEGISNQFESKDGKKEKERDDNEEDESPLPKVKAQGALISKSEFCNTGVAKIDGIFDELKRLDVKSHKHAVSVLLRTFFEITLSELLNSTGEIENLIASELSKLGPEKNGLLKRVTVFIDSLECTKPIHQQGLLGVLTSDSKADKEWYPSLRHMLDYIARDKVKLINVKLKRPIRVYLSGQNGLGHDDFNDFVHNQYMSPKEEALKEFWATLAPVFRSILRTLDLRNQSQLGQQPNEQKPESNTSK